MNVTLIHNPRCSKSKKTLQLLRDHEIEPDIIDYLKIPLTVEQLTDILQILMLQPRELIRKKETIYTTLGLDDLSLSDDFLIRTMLAHPQLIERPIVLTKGKGVIGRPPEKVLTLL